MRSCSMDCIDIVGTLTPALLHLQIMRCDRQLIIKIVTGLEYASQNINNSLYCVSKVRCSTVVARIGQNGMDTIF